MNEANVANTTTILGRTNVVSLYTHWKSIIFNDPSNRAALKINSLFIVNRSINNVDVDLRIARDPTHAAGAIYSGGNAYTYLMNTWTLPRQTTVVAISRDNPIWLQPGDFLQASTSLNYCLEAVCSYEFISDQSPEETTTLSAPGPVLNINAAPVYGSGGAQLAWSPPFSNGGVAISNYLVQVRARVIVSTSPLVEAWTGWSQFEKPVSEIPGLTISENLVLAQPRDTSFISDSYSPLVVGLSPSSYAGFQFRVAARNAIGLGAWSDPSELLRIAAIGTVGDLTVGSTNYVGQVEAISISAVPNGVTLNWTGRTAKLTPATGETLSISDYRIRWSDDNGMTWLPTASGIRLGSADTNAEIRTLQNGVDYVFSLQTICERNADPLDEIVGPWSPPTRNVCPPGVADSQAQNTVRAMFIRWE